MHFLRYKSEFLVWHMYVEIVEEPCRYNTDNKQRKQPANNLAMRTPQFTAVGRGRWWAIADDETEDNHLEKDGSLVEIRTTTNREYYRCKKKPASRKVALS